MCKLISVEGSIGVGKSTMIKELVKRANTMDNDKIYILIPEPVDEWKKVLIGGVDILTCFYQNKKEFAFSFQLLALHTRRKMMLQKVAEAKDLMKTSNKEVILITERTLFSDKYIFATMLHNEGFITDAEMTIYNLWNEDFCKDIIVDKFLYLNPSPNFCLDRVRYRNRDGEDSIDLQYLQLCQKQHDVFFEEHISKVHHKIVDTSKNPLGSDQYNKLIDDIIQYISI